MGRPLLKEMDVLLKDEQNLDNEIKILTKDLISLKKFCKSFFKEFKNDFVYFNNKETFFEALLCYTKKPVFKINSKVYYSENGKKKELIRFCKEIFIETYLLIEYAVLNLLLSSDRKKVNFLLEKYGERYLNQNFIRHFITQNLENIKDFNKELKDVLN